MFLRILLEGLKHGLIKLIYSYLVDGGKNYQELKLCNWSYDKAKTVILPFIVLQTPSLLHKAQNSNFWSMHTPELHYGRADLYYHIGLNNAGNM